MTLVLNHTIVRAGDKDASARFLADLLGLEVGAQTGPFTPVQINEQLTFDFDHRGPVLPTHFGFLVDDETLDHVLQHVTDNPDTPFGSGPANGWDRRINHLAGGRGVYVGDPDGHTYEFFTAVPD